MDSLTGSIPTEIRYIYLLPKIRISNIHNLFQDVDIGFKEILLPLKGIDCSSMWILG